MTPIKQITAALCLPLGAALCLSGCSTLAPKYTQPAAPVPAAWQAPQATQAATADTARPQQKALAAIPWQEFFVDARLNKLIELALKNNRDMKVATLTIQRYQALYQLKGADQLPKFEASAGASFQRVPETLSGKGKAIDTQQYSVGAGLLSYELDLFGRVQSLKEQALEQFFATEQAQKSVQLSLVSQVATAWLTCAADRERLQLAKDTLVNQQDSFKLVKSRFDAGISSSLALNQAQSTLEAAKVDIARYSAQVAQDENALSFLVGSTVPADLLPQTLTDSLTSLSSFPSGLASDVLLSRPDILQAESQLKGYNANIGAARAAFFPRITLVASAGFGSDELTGLFKSGSTAWSFAPRISIPIFDGGTNKANLKVAEVDRDIAVAQYEKAIQTAFREVADALALNGTIDEQLSAQQALTNATSESYKISRARYDKGVDSYLAVLDSQRSLYGAQQGLISTRQARLASMVSLYKALGGGK